MNEFNKWWNSEGQNIAGYYDYQKKNFGNMLRITALAWANKWEKERLEAELNWKGIFN